MTFVTPAERILIDKIGNVKYIGVAPAGTSESEAKWKISRIINTSGETQIEYASNNQSYDKIWDDKETYFSTVTPGSEVVEKVQITDSIGEGVVIDDDEGNPSVRIYSKGISTRPSGLNIGGKITQVTLNTMSWTALPASPLSKRNALAIQNVSDHDILINYDNTAALTDGLKIVSGNERQYDISDSIIIYAVALSDSPVITVEEIA